MGDSLNCLSLRILAGAAGDDQLHAMREHVLDSTASAGSAVSEPPNHLPAYRPISCVVSQPTLTQTRSEVLQGTS